MITAPDPTQLNWGTRSYYFYFSVQNK